MLVSVRASLQFYRMNLTPACNFLTSNQTASVSARVDSRSTAAGRAEETKYWPLWHKFLPSYEDSTVNVDDVFMEPDDS
jgi:hypothetical protein